MLETIVLVVLIALAAIPAIRKMGASSGDKTCQLSGPMQDNGKNSGKDGEYHLYYNERIGYYCSALIANCVAGEYCCQDCGEG